MDKSLREKCHYFAVTRISLEHSIGEVEGRFCAKNQLDLSSHVDKIPTCEAQMNRDSIMVARSRQHSVVQANTEKLSWELFNN